MATTRDARISATAARSTRELANHFVTKIERVDRIGNAGSARRLAAASRSARSCTTAATPRTKRGRTAAASAREATTGSTAAAAKCGSATTKPDGLDLIRRTVNFDHLEARVIELNSD